MVKSWQSSYATFAGNPIYYNDISGDEEEVATGGTTTGGKPSMDGGSAPNTKPKEGDARTNPNTGTEYKFQGGVWSAQGNAVEIPANNNKILDATVDVGKKLGIFLSGAVTAIITDNSPIPSNFSSFNFGLSEENAYYFNAGTTFGHASALVGGLFEAGAGIFEDFVGGAAVPVTGGLSVGLVLAGSFQIIHGGATASKAWLNLINSNNVFSKAQESGGGVPEYKKRKSKVSNKDGAKDPPSWAEGFKPYKSENGKAFAKRLMDMKYGKGNYKTGPGTEYNKIQKWGERTFE